jgi:hypothetical protein
VHDGYALTKGTLRTPLGGELLSEVMLHTVEAAGTGVKPRVSSLAPPQNKPQGVKGSSGGGPLRLFDTPQRAPPGHILAPFHSHTHQSFGLHATLGP